MKVVIATILFNFLCIIFFGVIYIYLKKGFINTNASLKNKIKLIDIILFSTTIQAGVGISNLLPNSFYLKLVTIIQQLTMICSYIFILYIITKKFKL
jgi:hypothetical protein